MSEATPDYQPSFPAGPLPGVAILGCGGIAKSAHLPAYARYGVPVVGVWSRSAATVAGLRTEHPEVGRIYDSPEELLADPAVQIVDIATPAADRLTWVAAAIAAGKHVLAQKPLTMDVDALAPILAEAQRRGLRVAVNQNARWAPAWRLATRLIEEGAIGDVVSITHLHDKPLPPLVGTPFDDVEHMLITDYLVHWVDIARCWLGGKQVTEVAARDSRVPGQPLEARNPWSASLRISCADGAQAFLHIPGSAATSKGSCPFWIHGTEGTIRGSVLLGSDFLEWERGGEVQQFALEGQWFTDGFAGTMGELMQAIAADRQPYNSAEHNEASLRIVIAARDSAEQGGAGVPVSLAL